MAVKSYDYRDTTQLTKHFNVQEFRCQCGGQHPINIDLELVNNVENFMTYIGATKCIISSGYRCPSHDRAVGGNGSGAHTTGQAVDCKFYKNDEVISTKLIACMAQDFGKFKGIANINSYYTNIHLDIKNRIYKGDEIKGTSSVTTDFYKYFNITKSQTAAITGVQTQTTTNTDDKTTTNKWSNMYDAQIHSLQKILNTKNAKLSEDGIAGEKTLTACKKYSIRLGDKGPLTKWVQTRLNSLGCSCGTPDGIAGQRTMSGIASFQKKNGLGVGYLGGNDWYYLIK